MLKKKQKKKHFMAILLSYNMKGLKLKWCKSILPYFPEQKGLLEKLK